MLRMVSIARIALVATVFLAAGCQPVRPLTSTPEAAACPTQVSRGSDSGGRNGTSCDRRTVDCGNSAGRNVSGGCLQRQVVDRRNGTGYRGDTAGPGRRLYSGTIDIPQQGATGIPLHDIAVDGSTVHFEMLAGPQTAKFDGEMAADGTISGTMTQSGYEGTFSLAPQQAAAARAAQNRVRRPRQRLPPSHSRPASPPRIPIRAVCFPCRYPPVGR